MRIGIDCRTILNPGFGEHTGVGHYTYYLITNLLKIDQKNEYVLFFDELLNHEVVNRIIGENKKVKAKFFPFHEYRHHLLSEYSKNLVNAFVLQENLDILHLPSPILSFDYPRKFVITLHDLALIRHPEWFDKEERPDEKIIQKAVQNADKIISVSEFTKKETVDIFKTAEDKIKVIYNGVDTSRHFALTEDVISPEDVVDLEDLQKKYQIDNKYVLFLGTIEPRKNILKLIEAFNSLLKKTDLNLQLVIAGIPGKKSRKILEEIEIATEKTNGKIKYLGYVEHNDKFQLIKHANCLINLSSYEGFGLQVLEAMDIETPVIASNKTSFPEIVGKGAFLVNSDSIEEIEGAINKILSDTNTRETIIKEGLKRAKSFSWLKTAEKTLAFYGEV